MHSSRLGLATGKTCMGFEDWLESATRYVLRSVWGQAPLQLIQPVSLWWCCRGQQLSKQAPPNTPGFPPPASPNMVMLGANTVAKHSISFAGPSTSSKSEVWRWRWLRYHCQCREAGGGSSAPSQVPVYPCSPFMRAFFLLDCWASWLQAQNWMEGHQFTETA